MDRPIKIVVADDNTDFLNLLVDYLSHVDPIQVVGAAQDGLQAVELIKTASPDLVLLDVIMPKIDGFGVLEELNRFAAENRPQTILFSAFGQERLAQLAMDLGADFFMMKPFNLHGLSARIKQFYGLRQFMRVREPNSADLVESGVMLKISGLLKQIGVPCHLKGYEYIKYAVEILLCEPTALRNMNRKIYARISRKFNTTIARVERDIRNAIEQAFLLGNLNLLYAIFGPCLSKEKLKPSNSEFFILFIDELKKL